MSTADDAWHQWASAHLSGETVGVVAVREGITVHREFFMAGYRRALEDAADEINRYGWPEMYDWLRDRAAGVGTKDGDDEAEPVCKCGHDQKAHEYEYSPVKGHCSHGGTNGVPECRCAKFRFDTEDRADRVDAEDGGR